MWKTIEPFDKEDGFSQELNCKDATVEFIEEKSIDRLEIIKDAGHLRDGLEHSEKLLVKEVLKDRDPIGSRFRFNVIS